jgi:hypothetical protein
VVAGAAAVHRSQDIELETWTALYQVRDGDGIVRWYTVAEDRR